MYKREIFKTKEEWLAARGLGGSSASAILDKNPYMSKLELFKAIVYPSKHKLDWSNDSMAYGTKCEEIIRKLFKYDFPQYRVHSPKDREMYRRTDKPYMTATLDGIIREKKTGRKGVLEIKTHDIRNRADEENWSNHIPENYYIQVLHYLLVMKDFDFAIIVGKLRFYDYFSPSGKKLLKTEIRYQYIERSEVFKDLEYLEKKETEFWEENVLKKKIPPLKITF